MGERTSVTILHVDLDAFYVSVEQLHRPELRGKPVVVGRGVVVSASYEARQFGIRSGMQGRDARRLCPNVVFAGGEFSNYTEASEQVLEICRRFTPAVEQISIDEAFLDIGGSVHLFGDAHKVGASLRQAVLAGTGLVVSVGAARTKFLAKVASRVAKPDGLLVVPQVEELRFLHRLPVDHMWGVGPATHRKLTRFGIATIADLAERSQQDLVAMLGKGAGRHLHALAWNRDPRGVSSTRRAGSVGAQSTFARQELDPEVWRPVLLRLADRVGARLRAKQRAGRTISARIRFADFETVTRSRTVAAPLSTTVALFRVADHLVGPAVAADHKQRGLRLLGISISGLVFQPHVQLELALGGLDDIEEELLRAGSPADLAWRSVDSAVDGSRERFGRDAVTWAGLL